MRNQRRIDDAVRVKELYIIIIVDLLIFIENMYKYIYEWIYVCDTETLQTFDPTLMFQ